VVEVSDNRIEQVRVSLRQEEVGANNSEALGAT
jgi:hypothetical protein